MEHSTIRDLPFYFGNQTAYDLLGLPRELNGTSEKDVENEMRQNLSLLLAGCGDLRNAIQTVHCIPEDYKGKLRFHLNDADRRVMARNVVLLYLIATGIDKVSITTIWLSTRISQKCYDYLVTALNVLSTSLAEKLKNVTNNVVEVDDGTLTLLKPI